MPFDFIQGEASDDSAWVQTTSGACAGEPYFREHDGKRYCVLHLADAERKEPFNVAVKKKLESEDFNYQGV